MLQGERFALAHNNDKGDDRRTVKMEEEFFVYAVSRAVFLIGIVGKEHPEYLDLLNQIDKAVGLKSIKDLRDMRTHIDAYEAGTGRNQSDFMHSYVPQISCAPTATIILGENYLIGGRLNAMPTILLFKSLLPKIIKLENQIRTASDGCRDAN